jgi:Zn2+/Cd2+-exporting ATPase
VPLLRPRTSSRSRRPSSPSARRSSCARRAHPDGRPFVEGESLVNQAPITGESRLLLKEPGSEVFASTVNGAGVLHVNVTHRAEDNTISRLIQMVEEAQEKRAPAQRFVDRFARAYTPAVVLLALFVAAVPPLFFGQPFLSTATTQGWLYRALALLVVACPCALVISTPVSLISAISNAAHHGVLVKGGAYLEALSRVRAVAFDKTGTLTRGEPTVVGVHSAACETPDERCLTCDDVLALAGAVEVYSEHPLAQAVRDASISRGVHGRYRPGPCRRLPGAASKGRLTAIPWWSAATAILRSASPMPPRPVKLSTPLPLRARPPSSSPGTTPTSATSPSPTRFAPAAPLRSLPCAKPASSTSSCSPATTRRRRWLLPPAVGVDDVRAGLLPAAKVDEVEALRQQYGSIAMVGDGINDAPALASATVGIAMGAAGTAQALETADVALMGDDLRLLSFLLRLSRATMNTIWANIALSLGIKAAFLLLVLFGYGSLWLAVFADMGASLIVTLNGMRLLRRPRPR